MYFSGVFSQVMNLCSNLSFNESGLIDVSVIEHATVTVTSVHFHGDEFELVL